MSALVSNIRVYWKSVCRIAKKRNLILVPVLVDQTGGQPVVVIGPRGLDMSVVLIDS